MTARTTTYRARYADGDQALAGQSRGHTPAREARSKALQVLATHRDVERVEVMRDGRVWLTVGRTA